MKKFNHLSDDSLLALYLMLCAAREGGTQVGIRNAALKYYFFGNVKGKRVE